MNKAKSLLNTRLDFTVEKSCLKTKKNFLISTSIKKEKQEIKESKIYDVNNVNLNISSNNTNNSTNKNPFLVFNDANKLLIPIKNSPLNTNLAQTNTININSNKNHQKLNDPLFETSSSDPFNDVELKTINEIEELKSILQNTNLNNTKINTTSSASSNLPRFAVDNYGLPSITSYSDLNLKN